MSTEMQDNAMVCFDFYHPRIVLIVFFKAFWSSLSDLRPCWPRLDENSQRMCLTTTVRHCLTFVFVRDYLAPPHGLPAALVRCRIISGGLGGEVWCLERLRPNGVAVTWAGHCQLRGPILLPSRAATHSAWNNNNFMLNKKFLGC